MSAPPDNPNLPPAAPVADASFRALFAASLDALLLTAPDGRILAANPAAGQMFGNTEEEICRLGRAGIVDSADPRLRPALEERLRTGQFRGQLTFLRSDGSKFEGEVSTAFYRDATGEPRTSMAIRDRSESVRHERLLEESRAFFHGVIDALSAHVCVLDPTGRIIAVNRAWHDFAAANGVETSRACTGANYLEICDRADGPDAGTAAEFACGIREVLSGRRRDFSLEYPCHSPTERRWFIGRVTPLPSRDSTQVVVAHENITPRKLAEEAVAESERRFRAISDYTADLECWFGTDGTLKWVNPAVEMITGYTVAECLAMPGFPRPLFAEEDAARNIVSFQEGVAGSRGSDWEFRFVRKDGVRRWASVAWQPIYSAEGTHLGHRSSVRDITCRKEAEQALRDSEAALGAAQRLAKIGSWRWDLRHDTARWSEETFRIFGLPPERLDRHRESFLNRLHPDDRSRVGAALTAAAAGTADYDLDYRICLPGGTEKVIHAQAELVRDPHGSPLALQGTVQDITERSRGEESLRKSQEQLRALATRLQAVREEERTAVAREIHDVLAQELTRLKFDLVWLQNRLAKGGPRAALAGLADRAAEMSRVADTAINSVQRIATGLRPAVLDSFGLGAAVEWQVREFEGLSGIACHLKLPETELAVGRDAATAAFRILQESLTNILRHARATRIEITLWGEDGGLMLRVHDNGCGLSPAALASPLSVGLVGMRERAVLLGGKLELSSGPGGGTTIFLRLPLAPAQEPPPSTTFPLRLPPSP